MRRSSIYIGTMDPKFDRFRTFMRHSLSSVGELKLWVVFNTERNRSVHTLCGKGPKLEGGHCHNLQAKAACKSTPASKEVHLLRLPRHFPFCQQSMPTKTTGSCLLISRWSYFAINRALRNVRRSLIKLPADLCAFYDVAMAGQENGGEEGFLLPILCLGYLGFDGFQRGPCCNAERVLTGDYKKCRFFDYMYASRHWGIPFQKASGRRASAHRSYSRFLTGQREIVLFPFKSCTCPSTGQRGGMSASQKKKKK